jgi:hypothetical protein
MQSSFTFAGASGATFNVVNECAFSLINGHASYVTAAPMKWSALEEKVHHLIN